MTIPQPFVLLLTILLCVGLGWSTVSSELDITRHGRTTDLTVLVRSVSFALLLVALYYGARFQGWIV